jgi:hypothetical protein
VHLEVVHVHEERLVGVGVILDVLDRVGGLVFAEGGEPLVGDLAEVLGRLARDAFPFWLVRSRGARRPFAECDGGLSLRRCECSFAKPSAKGYLRIPAEDWSRGGSDSSQIKCLRRGADSAAANCGLN